jgi:8-hydroxy-5-deazaflavin:NADPH oxidoreductase
MTYSIIGSGAIGTAVARHLARTNTPVKVANTRGPASLAALATRLGPNVVPAGLDEALAADLVVLAVPYDAVFDVVRRVGNWNGRIVVDATNAIEFPGFTPKDLGGRPSSRVVADAVPGARVVKAFNTMWARVLGRKPDDECGRRVLFLSGDDAAANKTVAALVGSWGFAPIDLGRLDAGGLLIQFGGPLTSHSLVSQPQGGPSLPEMDLLNP